MNEPIKIGDLVMFVRSCCTVYLDGVSIFKVEDMNDGPIGWARTCKGCRNALPNGQFASPSRDVWGAPVSWLKRIPPPEELGVVDEREELTA